MDEITKLTKLLSRGNSWERGVAAKRLGKFGVPAVPALIEALKEDRDEDIRSDAACALGRIGDVSAVPALIEALDDKDGYVRKEAAEALGLIGMPAVPALIEALKDPKKIARLNVADALGNIINRSSVEQVDKLKVQIIEAVETADKYAPTYREMKRAAAPLIVAIYNRRNTLLPVEVHIDPNMVLKRPKPPRGGMHRQQARLAA